MSLLINQLKNEYSFMHEWNGMQKKKETGGLYLSLVLPVLF